MFTKEMANSMLFSNPGCRWLIMNILICYTQQGITITEMHLWRTVVIDLQVHFKELWCISNICSGEDRLCPLMARFILVNSVFVGWNKSCESYPRYDVQLFAQEGNNCLYLYLTHVLYGIQRSHLSCIFAAVTQDSGNNTMVHSSNCSSKQANSAIMAFFMPILINIWSNLNISICLSTVIQWLIYAH